MNAEEARQNSDKKRAEEDAYIAHLDISGVMDDIYARISQSKNYFCTIKIGEIVDKHFGTRSPIVDNILAVAKCQKVLISEGFKITQPERCDNKVYFISWEK